MEWPGMALEDCRSRRATNEVQSFDSDPNPKIGCQSHRVTGWEQILRPPKHQGLASAGVTFALAGIGGVGVSPISSATFDSIASAQTR